MEPLRTCCLPVRMSCLPARPCGPPSDLAASPSAASLSSLAGSSEEALPMAHCPSLAEGRRICLAWAGAASRWRSPSTIAVWVEKASPLIEQLRPPASVEERMSPKRQHSSRCPFKLRTQTQATGIGRDRLPETTPPRPQRCRRLSGIDRECAAWAHVVHRSPSSRTRTSPD